MAVEWHGEAVGSVGSRIVEEFVAHGQNTAVFINRHLGVVNLVALMGGGHKMLGPVFNPLNRTAELDGQPRHEELFGVEEHDFGAEAAADKRGDDPHLVLGETKKGGHAVAQEDGCLGGVPNGQPMGAAVPFGHHAPCFHRGGCAVVVVKAALDDGVRLGRNLVKFSAAPLHLHDMGVDVVRDVVVDAGGGGMDGRLHLHHRLE